MEPRDLAKELVAFANFQGDMVSLRADERDVLTGGRGERVGENHALMSEGVTLMTIPESQLETWSHPGASTTAKTTYESIQNALYANDSPLNGKDFESYLQGSYKNTTNIRGDSDVDVVVQLNSTWGRDLSLLAENERRLYEVTYPNATYLFSHFYRDVRAALENYYGPAAVSDGRKGKSMKVARGSGRLPSDVVPCLHYRRYLRFRGEHDQLYVDGIKFYTRPDDREVINYPKPHYDNGVEKNSKDRTAGWYKPIVRLFKNARSRLIDDQIIGRELAPSHFLECLLYNVPDQHFGVSYQESYCNILNWLQCAPLQSFICQNEQAPLFGPSPEQWSNDSALQLIDALIHLWNNWR